MCVYNCPVKKPGNYSLIIRIIIELWSGKHRLNLRIEFEFLCQDWILKFDSVIGKVCRAVQYGNMFQQHEKFRYSMIMTIVIRSGSGFYPWLDNLVLLFSLVFLESVLIKYGTTISNMFMFWSLVAGIFSTLSPKCRYGFFFFFFFNPNTIESPQ